MPSKKLKAFALTVIIMVSLLLCSAMFITAAQKPITIFLHHQLVIQTKSGSHPIEVEVAISPREQAQGLMFRKNVPENTGMIFLFGAPQRIDMWMKNTLVSLDMLFVDEKGHVMSVVENAKPESEDIISSEDGAKAVIELPAGSAKRLQIAKGDKVVYSYFNE